MDWAELAVGLWVIALATGTAIYRHSAAKGIQRWYGRFRAPAHGPKWYRWKFSPTEHQSMLMTWAISILGIGLGAMFVIESVR